VLFGGRSFGIARHWQPVLRIYMRHLEQYAEFGVLGVA
jgi:hypothetical protein